MQQAAALTAEFTDGRCFDEYLAEVMLRSAVERQVLRREVDELVGEP
jgi:hypothetical protein